MSDRTAEFARGRNRDTVEGLKQNVAARAPRFAPFIVASFIWTYAVGALGLSLLWLAVPILVLWLVWREQRTALVENLVNEIGTRIFRQRAFRKAETAEWANILLNRWWACSSESLFETFTSSLNPLLHDFKPNVIDSIELTDVQLGGHTPFVKDVSVLEMPVAMAGSPESQVLTPNSSQIQPDNLRTLPCRHQVIINATVGFSAPNAQLVFKTKIKTVGAVLAIQLENFHFDAQTQLVLTMDSEAPFPHFTNLSFTFLSKPNVWLNIRVLKGLQIMQLPIIKNWLHSLIMDSLKETLVDPYRYSMDITNKENDSMVSKGDRAAGVLTVMLENQGLATADNLTCWCTVRVGDQKYKTPVCSSRQTWNTAYSFLCNSPHEETLLLKVLTRKMLRKSTLLEHPSNLSSFVPRPASRTESRSKRNSTSSGGNGSTGSDTAAAPAAAAADSLETVSRQHSFPYRGGQLSMEVSYSPLKPISLNDDDEASLRSTSPSETECCCGVLYVCMHSGSNLLAMDDDGTSDPYCVLMANKRKVFTTSFQANTLDPTWEQGVEFFTADYRKARLTFLCYDWDGRVSGDDFLGLTTLMLEPGETSICKRKMDLRFSASAAADPKQAEMIQQASTVTTDGRPSPTSPRAESGTPKTLSSAFNRLKSFSFHDGGGGNRRSQSAMTSPLNMSLGNITVSVVFRPVKSVGLSESAMAPKTATTETEVAALALQGGLNLARLEETGGVRIKSELPSHVAYGLASPGVVHVTIHQARDLVAKDFGGKSDPYCVVRVGNVIRYKTRTIPKTLFPRWEESFTIEYLKPGEKLTVGCYDKDTLSDDALGTLQLDMDMISNCTAGPGWFTLQNIDRGSVQLSFKVDQALYSGTSSDDSSAVSSGAPLSNCPSSVSSASYVSRAESNANPTNSSPSTTGSGSQTAGDGGEASRDTGAASPKSRVERLRRGGHSRSRSVGDQEQPQTSESPLEKSNASRRTSGSSDNISEVPGGDQDQIEGTPGKSISDMDVSSSSLASESADGSGMRRRRPIRQSMPAQSSSSGTVRPTNPSSQLFFLSGTVIRADGLKGEADSLELYAKIRLNSRSLFERAQPFSRGPEIYKTRRIKGTLAPEWRETFQVEETSVSSDSLVTVDLKSGSKTTIGTQTIVLDKFMEGLTQKTKWLDMGNGARLELSLACQHLPPSPNGSSSGSGATVHHKRTGSFFRRQRN